MSTLKSSAEDLTLNADGSGNDIKFQSNGVEKASIDQDGVITATGGIITSSGTDVGGVIEITANSLTSGRVLNVVSNGMTTGNLANFYSNTADTGTRDLVKITNDNTAATGTTALKVTQDSTGLCADFVGDKIRVADGILLGTDTAAANTLDDYEEGTWTASFSGTTSTPGNAEAFYAKIGNVVYVYWYSGACTFASSTGAAQILGLPYTISGNGYSTFHYHHGVGVDGDTRGGYFMVGTTKMQFIDKDSTNHATYVDGSSKYLMISGFYMAA